MTRASFVDFRLLRSIFVEAMRLPRAERTTYLDAACAGLPQVRKEVESLLTAAETSGAAGDGPMDTLQAATSDEGTLEYGRQGETWIGPYRILRHVATGGMGVVYEAEDPRLGRRVAIKTLPESWSGDPDRLAGLEREARVLASLNHPNIATIHSLEESSGVRFLTMEFVRGHSLAERLAKGPLDIEHGMTVGRRVARAIEAANEAGIVHRDLKPTNVMVTGRDEVKVLDFGIAKGPRGDTTNVPEGAVAGTPGYMSPEQLRGQPVDARTDVFALGALLYECFTGRPAFQGRSVSERARDTLDNDPPASALPGNVPESVRSLLFHCLAKDVGSRPTGMTDVRNRLDRSLEEWRREQLLSSVAKTPSESPHNLPRRLTRFIGRMGDRAAVSGLLDDHALVTVTGVGGCGKSRLAIAVSRDRLPDFPDGVWHVDVASLSDAELIAPAILRAAGLRATSSESAVDALSSGFRGKRVLIVLDNCEHVLDAVGTAIGVILAEAPQAKVLTTSREALRVEGEALHPLRPLELPPVGANQSPRESLHDVAESSEAVQLFVDRATLANPHFRLSASNADAVLTICRRLDGLPLALELAAGRAASLPATELVKRLDRCIDVASPRVRAQAGRHPTLAATIDWSHDQLDDAERTLFRRLAAFTGGWTAEAAEQVASGGLLHESDVLDVLSCLVDKSLVVVHADDEEAGRVRYGLLETLQRYARRRLEEAGETSVLEQRHRSYFMSLATRDPNAMGTGVEANLRALGADMDNFRLLLNREGPYQLDTDAGLALCTCLGPLWELRGEWSEGRRHLDGFLGRDDCPRIGGAAAPALYWAGRLAKNQADFDEASRRFEESLALATKANDDVTIADALQGLGNVAEHMGAFDEARVHYERGLDVARILDEPRRVAVALGNLGVIAKDQGDLEGARGLYEQSLRAFRELNDLRGVATSLNNLGAAAVLQEDLPSARTYMKESLDVRTELGDKSGIATGLHNLGQIDAELGHHDAARRMLFDGLVMRIALGQHYYVASSLFGLAQLAERTSDPESAVRLIAQSVAIRTHIRAEADPQERQAIESLAAGLKEELGADRFESAWQRGAGQTIEETVAELKRS